MTNKTWQDKMLELKPGDYVLGTYWSDGDPHDPWAVGFYKDQYHIVDYDGTPINGRRCWRRIQKLKDPAVGTWLLRYKDYLSYSGFSLWHFVRRKRVRDQLSSIYEQNNI